MFEEKRLVEECKKNNSVAQKELYNNYCGIVIGVCFRYLANKENAEDLMQDVLVKVLTQINKFEWRGNGSLNAWIKRIAVNTCIKFLEKKKKHLHINAKSSNYTEIALDDNFFDEELLEMYDSENPFSYDFINMADFTEEELLNLLMQLPEPFRNAFNLYVIENYKHEEIASMLNINIKTSRTRLLRARKLLKDLIYNKVSEKVKTQWNEKKLT